MMKFLVTLLLCMVPIALIGCGATPLSQNQKDLQSAAYTAQTACYERLKVQDNQLTSLLAKIPDTQIALVIVIQGMQENNKALMAIATGNEYNPCANGASAFDVQIAEVTEKNRALSSGLHDAAGLGKWIVGGLTVSSVADKIGQTTVNGDNNELNENSKNTAVVSDEDASVSTYNSSNPSNHENENSQNISNPILE